MTAPIPAAGTVPWRRRRGQLEVALVHRPKYDDWSWAKGKLDPGEEWPVAAVRETLEETSLSVGLGRPLPGAEYAVLDGTGQPATKEVRYWAAEATRPAGPLLNEIDEVRWLDVVTASDRLDYARDRDQLRALVRADNAGTLTTWPLALVRHAHAVGRGSWSQDDRLRPLDPAGEERAAAIAPVLAAYGVKRLTSSPSVRCTDTLRPFAAQLGAAMRTKEGLSEEGYAAEPARAGRHLERLLERGAPAALCSHGPVLPTLLAMLLARVAPDEPEADLVEDALRAAAHAKMAKGEVLVAHLVGTGPNARVVAVERHLPSRPRAF
ncbi:8-oxo-dGTP diphosphatase [Phycicoccus badiiscoriae]|uniref:8-oxo-dGTP diphosphatase n=1 Tax=Pedococcus badiiscoriae TaxID=642776 RepID=A0A852WDM1_9MICO|nr:NUDIX hydrolase [Pedococcus badiiscoriae]NYG07128.1 8-oxo-dGTP diphosphatase [Pedococcus badiiscoriae]